jgi:hypothetical protein
VSDDLDDPAGFVNRRDTDDPIAELEKQFAAESESSSAESSESSESSDSSDSSEEKPDDGSDSK